MRDTIHGMIEISENEMAIINTSPFQRLRYIRQLATAYLVYPGAEHTRFGHSIGTMHVASRVIQSIKRKHPNAFYKDEQKQNIHWAWMEQMLRLMALTHDLGHPPFSHAGEGLLPANQKHENITAEIVASDPIKGIIDEIGSKFCDEHRCDKWEISAKSVVNTYLGKGTLSRDSHILNFLMDSEYDCDKMDYLLRDSHYCGVNYGQYDLERLLTSIGLGKDDEGDNVVAIHRDGLHAFEEFVLARYFMFLQVYFHKTRRILDIVLNNCLKQLLPSGEYPASISEYLCWNDNAVLQLLQSHSEDNNVIQLTQRKFPRLIYETPAHAESRDDEKYKRIKRELVDNGISFIEDDASKLPHNIPSLINTGEKAVYLLDKGETRNIMSFSYVLNRISSSIHIRRLYAHPSDRTFAEEISGRYNY